MVGKETKKKSKYTTISIPTPLAGKLKKRIEGTGFTSLSSYVIYVLRQLLSSIEKEEIGERNKEVMTREEEETIKSRLRALGYLD